MEIHSKLKTIALGKAEKRILYSHQRYYERANKSHTLLAKMLMENAAQRIPYSVCNDKRTETHDPGEVASLPDTLPANVQQRHALLQDFLSSWALTKAS